VDKKSVGKGDLERREPDPPRVLLGTVKVGRPNCRKCAEVVPVETPETVVCSRCGSYYHQKCWEAPPAPFECFGCEEHRAERAGRRRAAFYGVFGVLLVGLSPLFGLIGTSQVVGAGPVAFMAGLGLTLLVVGLTLVFRWIRAAGGGEAGTPRGWRCPYCHTDLAQGEERVACERCGAWHHPACWEEAGSCSACQHDSAAQAATQPLAAWVWGILPAWVLGPPTLAFLIWGPEFRGRGLLAPGVAVIAVVLGVRFKAHYARRRLARRAQGSDAKGPRAPLKDFAPDEAPGSRPREKA
jgi:hypothetical protein